MSQELAERILAALRRRGLGVAKRLFYGHEPAELYRKLIVGTARMTSSSRAWRVTPSTKREEAKLICLRILCGLVLGQAAACRPKSHSPPSHWKDAVQSAIVGPACLQMIGHSFRRIVVTTPRTPIGTTAVDPTDPALPPAIRSLHPRRITVSPTEVDIELGTYNPTEIKDELDGYGIVCSLGRFSNDFLKSDGGTYLQPLGSGLWSYEGHL